MKYSWSILSQKSLLIFVSSILQVFSTFLFETDGHCHQMSFLLSENREVYGGFCQDYAATQFDAEREKRVTKCWSDSVEITQDVSEWYRECQSCRKKSPLQLLRPAEHDLCGRLGFIHTKSTAWKLLLESDSSGLEKGIMCTRELPGNKENYQVTIFGDLWHWPHNQNCLRSQTRSRRLDRRNNNKLLLGYIRKISKILGLNVIYF